MATIRFTRNAGWARFQKALKAPQWRRNAQNAIKRANGQIGAAIRTTSRKMIQAGQFEKNAALTISIKRSSKPLADTGEGLWKAITVEQPAWNTAFVGVLFQQDVYNIAKALHNGCIIKVTQKMRTMFYYLWLASQGRLPRGRQLTGRAAELWKRKPGGWYPLKDTTTKIKIPARPFIDQAFDDPSIKALAEQLWTRAIEDVARRMVR